MKNLKKYWWIILILVAGVYILILNRKINQLSDEKQLQAVRISSLQDTVLTIVTKNGQLISKINSTEIEKDNLKESLKILEIDRKKLRDDNIKWRRLNNILQLKLSSIGKVETIIRDTFEIEKTDTIYFSKVDDWTNNYLSLFDGRIEKQKLSFDYRYQTGLKIFQEPTKDGTVVTVKLSDPNASIISANSTVVVPKKTIWQKWWLWTAVGVGGGIMIAK